MRRVLTMSLPLKARLTGRCHPRKSADGAARGRWSLQGRWRSTRQRSRRGRPGRPGAGRAAIRTKRRSDDQQRARASGDREGHRRQPQSRKRGRLAAAALEHGTPKRLPVRPPATAPLLALLPEARMPIDNIVACQRTRVLFAVLTLGLWSNRGEGQALYYRSIPIGERAIGLGGA